MDACIISPGHGFRASCLARNAIHNRGRVVFTSILSVNETCGQNSAGTDMETDGLEGQESTYSTTGKRRF